MKLFGLLLASCAIITIAVLFTLHYQGGKPDLALQTLETTTSASSSPRERQEFLETSRAEYLEILNTQGARAALVALRERAFSSEETLRICHQLSHELGRAAFAHYGDFARAMHEQMPTCNSGYIHGIIEAQFAESEDVERDMGHVCDSYDSPTYLSWECYHGVGHGLMYYTGNNLPESLLFCATYSDTFARETCVNGVFMENFNAEKTLHPPQFVNVDDFFYPCGEQDAQHKSACYLYSPTFFLSNNQNAYVAALQHCSDAPLLFRASCAQGVGMQVIKEHASDPTYAEAVCESHLGMRTACIRGVAGTYVLHTGSLVEARPLCDKLSSANESVCRSAMDSLSHLFEDE